MVDMRNINKIIIHCSYTRPSQDIGAAEIRAWHVQQNNWADIGYHYVITRNGLIEMGRPALLAGAHTRGHNEDSIGVCLIGGMDEDDRTPVFNFTRSQMDALTKLVEELLIDSPFAKIHGHNEFDAGKECPCFNVQEYFKGL